eukprot:INCI4514.1.p1 GENE.INCI4514.1~~INCI4514.1.p1  ORF type:complete len:802 (-),score=132.41 INCI4514.1:114-2186(-)
MEDEFQFEQYRYMVRPVKILILVRVVGNLASPAYTLAFEDATPFQSAVLLAHHILPWVILGLLTLLPKLVSNKNMQARLYRRLLILQVLADTCLECAIAGANMDPFPPGPYLVACGAALARLNWLVVSALSFVAFSLYWGFFAAYGHDINSLALSGCVTGLPLMWVVSRFSERSLREDFWTRAKLDEFSGTLRTRFAEFTRSATSSYQNTGQGSGSDDRKASSPPADHMQLLDGAGNDEEPTVTKLFGTLKLADKVNDLIVKSERRQSLFMSMVSHELRTPLAGMMGCLTLLTVPENELDLVQHIKRSADNLLLIVNNILDFSKFQHRKDSLVLEKTIFDPRDVVTHLATMTAPTCAEKGIRFRVNTAKLTPGVRFVADVLRTEQIISNLLSNATKFTDRGGSVTLSVSDVKLPLSKPGAETQWAMRVSVHDTGIGMSKQTMSEIFRPFTQADGSITRQFGGTGLGLTIANQLAECMGSPGITVASEDGEFSIFTVKLPLHDRFIDAEAARADTAEVRARAIAEAFSEETKEDPPLPRKGFARVQPNVAGGSHPVEERVLVVDDSPVVLRLTVGMLQKLGYCNVDTAKDGQEAVNAVLAARKKNQAFDVVFMDFHMPNLDGISAARTISKESTDGWPYIIGFTADVTGDVERKFKKAGAKIVISKPLSPETLAKVLGAAVPDGAAVPESS